MKSVRLMMMMFVGLLACAAAASAYTYHYDPQRNITTNWATVAPANSIHWSNLADGIYTGAAPNITNYIQQAGSATTVVDEVGRGPLPYTAIINVTARAYVATTARTQITIELLNNGTSVGSLVVGANTAASWQNVTWSSSQIGNLSMRFSEIRTATGAAGTATVYAAYFDVNTNITTNLSLYNTTGTLYENSPITFYANYTNQSDRTPISGANCQINFSRAVIGSTAGPFSMTYDAGTGTYQFNASFEKPGALPWTVLCSKTGYFTQTAQSTTTVSSPGKAVYDVHRWVYNISACGTLACNQTGGVLMGVYNNSAKVTIGDNEPYRITIGIVQTSADILWNVSPSAGTTKDAGLPPGMRVGNTANDIWDDVSGALDGNTTDGGSYSGSMLQWYPLTGTSAIYGNNDSQWVNFSYVMHPNGYHGNVTVTFTANTTSGSTPTIINPFEFIQTLPSDITPPTIISVLTNDTIYGINDTVLILARVTDNVALDSVIVNISIPSAGTALVPLTFDSLSGQYEANFNITATLGRYNLTILANDTSGNVNRNGTTTFRIVRPYMNAAKYVSQNPVQIGDTLQYYINYSVNYSTGKVLLQFSDFKLVTPHIAADDSPQLIETQAGTLMIAFHSNSGTNNDIYVTRSTDKGSTWGTPIQVTYDPQEDTFPNIRQDSSGNILIAYDHEATAGNYDIWIKKSSDDGLTWTGPYAVTTTSPESEMEPSIAQDSHGTYYVIFEWYNDTRTEIGIRNSSSYSSGWSNTTLLTNDSYINVDPDLLIQNDMFYFTWAPGYPQYQQIWFANTTNPMVFNAMDDNKRQVTNNSIYNYETSLNRDNQGNFYIGWVGLLNVSQAALPNVQRDSNEVFLAVSYDNAQTWDIRQITNNNYSDAYPGIVQTSEDGLFYISALKPNGGVLNVDFAQRVLSPLDTVNATVVDTLPTGTIIDTVGNSGTFQNNTITWKLPILYAGTNGSLWYTVKVNSTVKNGTLINNTANVSYYDPKGRLLDLIYPYVNTTAIDTRSPGVTIVVPTPGTIINESLPQPIKANVTEQAIIDTVFANVTNPLGVTTRLTLTLNLTSGYYEGTFLNTLALGRYNITVIANDTTGNVNNTATTYFFASNGPPTTPLNLTCNGGSCTGTYNTSMLLKCLNSTDPENDTITYHIEALYSAAHGNQTLINSGFENDTAGMNLLKDAYGTSASPQEAGARINSGNCTSGYCLGIDLNTGTPTTGVATSAAWNESINITDSPAYVKVSFDYRLRMSDPTDNADNITLYYTNVTDGTTITGPVFFGTLGIHLVDDYTTGTISYIAPATGAKQFQAGCKLGPMSTTDKNGSCYIDNMAVVAVDTSTADRLWTEIGTNNATTSYNWSIVNQNSQSNVSFRCRAIDNGSFVYSNYFTTGNASIVGFGPQVLAFTLTLPGQAFTNASNNETSATMFFNSTSNTYYNMNPCVQGTASCQNSTSPFFFYLNTGTVKLNLSIALNAELPPVLRLKAYPTNDSASAFTVNTTSRQVGSSIAPSGNLSLYFWGDFINAMPWNSSIRNLTSTGVQS